MRKSLSHGKLGFSRSAAGRPNPYARQRRPDQVARRRNRLEWEFLAEKRLQSVLRTHGIATDRTLEQKISDAGPLDQRIDPHILTEVRATLVKRGEIVLRRENGIPWYHLNATPVDVVQQRLDQLRPIYSRTQEHSFKLRVGQALEIAIFRSLQNLHADAPGVHFFGGFRDLDKHDDSTLYSKIEPEVVSGRRAHRGVVDFVLAVPSGILAAIEAKNSRQWIYPNRSEVKDLLRKSLELDAVPVLIARRIPFVTMYVLNPCGVLVHETYNQLYPAADAELADLVKDKRLLGYHDIRVGNQADARLHRFITELLVPLLPGARDRLARFRDLLEGYASDEHSYASFAARVRRRVRREPEDGVDASTDEEAADWPFEA